LVNDRHPEQGKESRCFVNQLILRGFSPQNDNVRSVILNHVLNWFQDLTLRIWIPEQVRNDGSGTRDSVLSTE